MVKSNKYFNGLFKMSHWKPIDFQGIISFDLPIIALLEQYLNEKEGKLALDIVKALPSIEEENLALENSPKTLLEVNHLFEERGYLNQDGKSVSWDNSIKNINRALWDYVEILESCTSECFLQLNQISMELWHEHLEEVIGAIKDILLKRQENLIWEIKRLNYLICQSKLSQYKVGSLNYYVKKTIFYWRGCLDKALIDNLSKTSNALRELYQKFNAKYQHYEALLKKAQSGFQKFSDFAVLNSLDSDVKKAFLQVYQLLKLWEINRNERVLPNEDFIIALRHQISLEKAVYIFTEYYKRLKDSLFEKGIVIKENAQDLQKDSPYKIFTIALVADGLLESQLLGLTILHYREFLLRVDPDPYVRTRLGFSEWTTGPEPTQLKPLLNLGYEVETLSELFEKLENSLKKPISETTSIKALDPEIQEILHEMSNPLATHRFIRVHAEKILEKIQILDELGSLDINVIDYVGDVISKILRLDWKYNLLQGIPLFHQLYSIHEGLAKFSTDHQHQMRLHKFKRFLEQIQNWVKNQKIQEHQHDIEIHMNDVKSYLQDFLAHVQRYFSEELTSEQKIGLYKEISKQLLEYRYLFSQFFYQLRQNETEGPLIRRQFLFVDQYFETIAIKLDSLKSS